MSLVRSLVELGLHARLCADGSQHLFEFFAQERIFFIVRNRRAAILHIDGAVIDCLLSGSAALASGSIGPEPGGEPQRLPTGTEVRMEPIAAHRRSADHADRLVILSPDQFRFAGLPWPRPQRRRPGVSAAFG